MALDGAGRTSSFAAALAKHISASNDGSNAILIAVHNSASPCVDAEAIAVTPLRSSGRTEMGLGLTRRFYFGGVAERSSMDCREMGAFDARVSHAPGSITLNRM